MEEGEESGSDKIQYKCVGLQARLMFRTADLGGAGSARVCVCEHIRTCLREEDV